MCRRSNDYIYGIFQTAELYLPGMFTANGHPQYKTNPILLQYLQHSTHSPEKDMIWDEDEMVATFKGKPKLASLHMSHNSRYLARVASWRGDGPVLQQLRIYDCNGCNETWEHRCSGQCCAIPQNEFLDVGNRYVELARITCKKDIADGTTCDGSKCQQVERLLPGAYIWFGHAALTHDISAYDLYSESNEKMNMPAEPLTEDDFMQKWDKHSQYGSQSFVGDLHNLLTGYEHQIPRGRKVVLRCGGTLLYQQEICYVIIVTFDNDGCHDTLPPVNNPHVAGQQCDWSGILDDNGRYRHVYDRYPLFVPFSKKNQIVFAFHLPGGMTLPLQSEKLVGGTPLETQHLWCHRHKYLKGQLSTTQCRAEERSYHQWLREHVSLQVSQIA